MTDSREWTGRVGDSWAALWRETDRSLAPVTARLLTDPATDHFDHALDIGCGAGEIACALAARRPVASVTGVDISSALLGAARARCPQAHFAEADAASYRPATPPDLLVSRHGVMFFADPVAAFSHLREIASPGARLLFSCFRRREDNPWATALAQVAAPAVPASASDADAPGPFAFGDAARVEHILTRAGWEAIAFDPLDYAMVVGEGAGAERDAIAYFHRIGPAAGPLAALTGPEREAAAQRLAALVASHHAADTISMPAAAWIVTARAPG